jgi:hypothetical protein
MTDGSAVEVGLTGKEGMVGFSVMLGARTSTTEANVQLKGRPCG